MRIKSKIGLILFSIDPVFIHHAVSGGVEGIIVDWEHVGKNERQKYVDTQINRDTYDDLCRVRISTSARVICRVNNTNGNLGREIEQAIEGGADEILLPMIRTAKEVEKVFNQVNGRCGVGILVETLEAVGLVEDLARLPLSRVYVGLNDLAIERNTCNIFSPLLDGTLERIRERFTMPFGFGGLTLPDRGYPIPCRLLIAEMTRLRCDFSFLRRSFYRDIRGRDMKCEIPRLLEAVREADRRSPREVKKDREDLESAIRAWPEMVLLPRDSRDV